jgi:hypothetical protein
MGVFDMRLVAGEITSDKLKQFNNLRDELANRSINYKFYFKSKSNTIRLFVEVFLELTDDFLVLVNKLEAKDANASGK